MSVFICHCVSVVRMYQALTCLLTTDQNKMLCFPSITSNAIGNGQNVCVCVCVCVHVYHYSLSCVYGKLCTINSKSIIGHRVRSHIRAYLSQFTAEGVVFGGYCIYVTAALLWLLSMVLYKASYMKMLNLAADTVNNYFTVRICRCL